MLLNLLFVGQISDLALLISYRFYIALEDFFHQKSAQAGVKRVNQATLSNTIQEVFDLLGVGSMIKSGHASFTTCLQSPK